ncbi:MAG: restriction endonuclease subunit S [Phocaeicola massiliensis]
MNGKQLKNSILQWAIQGKLVPQDPNDEPASVLLERIRAEKARLVKEKKIKKDKNESIIYRGEDNSYYEKLLASGEVKCIDEEVPFEIPQGWEWCRLRDVIYPPKYGTSSKSLSNGDVPVLRMGNIQDGEVVYDKLVFSNNVEDNRKYLLQDGDLLFNRTNSAELVGKTAIFKGNRHVIYAGYLILLRPIKTNSEYLNYIFSSPYVRSYCKEVKTIGVQQCNINAEKVSQLLVPIAPFEEQMRIVDKIKEVVPSVDKYSISQYNLDLLNVSLSECLKKSILQEAIQGRLVPQIAEEGTAKELLERIKKEKQKLVKEGKLKKSALNDTVIFRGDDNKYYEQIGKKCLDITELIPFEIPNSWTWARMGQIGDWGAGSTPQRSNQDYYGGNILWLKTGELNNGVICDTEERITQRAFQECSLRMNKIGDVLIAMYGATIGKLAIVGKELTTNQACCGCTPYIVYNWFLFYFLMASRDTFIKKGEGGAQPNISRVKLVEHLIPLPPLNEQKRIVERIETLFEQL